MGVIAKSGLLIAALGVGLFLTSHVHPRTAPTPTEHGFLATLHWRSDAALDWPRTDIEPHVEADVRSGAASAPSLMTFQSATLLAERCAPEAPTATLVSIVKIESNFAPWTVRVNGAFPASYRAQTKDEAVQIATRLIASGKNIDLGLAQINSRNLPQLGLTVAEALDPCKNLAAAAEILNQGYAHALSSSGPNRSLLQTAYSLYNTGDTERGLVNGYAAKVEAAGRMNEQ